MRPIRTQYQQGTQQGKVLVPVSITRNGADYSDSAVLIGAWNNDMTISWNLSQRMLADASKSTIGFCEPTIAEMPDGRILMVCARRQRRQRKPSRLQVVFRVERRRCALEQREPLDV